jgi:hypothetical protein
MNPTAASQVEPTAWIRYRDGATRAVALHRLRLPVFEGSVPWRTLRSRRGQQHPSGSHWAATTGGHVVYESRLELARLLPADFDPDVTAIYAQPCRLVAVVAGRCRAHVPDFLLASASGVVRVVNVKPAERLAKPKIAEALAWPGVLVERHGWCYEIWSGCDPVVLDNVRFLAAYRRPGIVAGAAVEQAWAVVGWLQMVQAPPRPQPPLLSAAELAALPRRERLRYDDQRMVWHANLGPIRTPQLLALHDHLGEVVESNRHDGDKVKPGVIVDAYPGLGKTTAVLAFARQFRLDQVALRGETTPEGHRRVPVVYVALTANTSMRSLNEAICRFYGLPLGGNADQLAARATDAVLSCGSQLLLIDDIHFLDMRRRDARVMANHLKHLANTFPLTRSPTTPRCRCQLTGPSCTLNAWLNDSFERVFRRQPRRRARSRSCSSWPGGRLRPCRPSSHRHPRSSTTSSTRPARPCPGR